MNARVLQVKPTQATLGNTQAAKSAVKVAASPKSALKGNATGNFACRIISSLPKQCTLGGTVPAKACAVRTVASKTGLGAPSRTILSSFDSPHAVNVDTHSLNVGFDSPSPPLDGFDKPTPHV